MRPFRVVLLLAVVPWVFTGCGLVHFGRLPEASMAGGGDLKAAETITNLTTENKLLKQELALVRRDSDTMRSAIERGSTTASPELATRLSETARELAALRESYAKLQAERGIAPGGGNDPAAAAKLSDLEDRLANSLRSFTQLQEENARLRTDLARARAENGTLAEQLKISITQTEQAQASLSQLNTELLTHRDARIRAEQAAAATRAQLNSVVAGGSLAGARESAAPVATGLQIPNNPGSSTIVAELRTNPERMQAAATAAAAAPAPATTMVGNKRMYTVQDGDTLEKIARQFYGDASSWTKIYLANNPLLRDGRPLRPGMELELPVK